MPPKSVADQMNRQLLRRLLGRKVQFRFYPQCVKCSSRQGSLLSTATQQLKDRSIWRGGGKATYLQRAGGGSNAHYHGFRPRLYTLAGGVVAATAVVGLDATAASSRDRYQLWQTNIERIAKQTYSAMRDKVNGLRSCKAWRTMFPPSQ
jgi:hypothetical protein